MGERSTSVAPNAAAPLHAFITPSASPPIHRSIFTSYALKKDRSSPAKRLRLSSTPSSAFSVSTLASSSKVTQDDIEAQRRASKLRLLNIWDQLEERYNVPLDEDDIIDLHDIAIVKDRGVVRRSSRRDFGCEDLWADANDASSEGAGGEEADDDIDELDAFAPGANISEELQLEKEKFVRARDPIDAQDLEKFMEAENKRREMYGDEDEEDVMDLGLLANAVDDEYSDALAGTEDNDEDHEEESVVSREDKKDRRSVPIALAPRGEALVAPEDESEDELAIWEIDDSTPFPRVACPSVPADDVIDLTDSAPPSPVTKRARSKSVARGKSKPPSPVRFRSKSRARSKTPGRKKTKLPSPSRSLPPTPVAQLCTPPQSSSSVVESTPDFLAFDAALDLPPPPSRPRPMPKPRYKGATSSAYTPNPGLSSRTEEPDPDWDVPFPRPRLVRKATRPRLVPEVVITQRSRKTNVARKVSKGVFKDTSDAHNVAEDGEEETPAPEPRISPKDKGKGREAVGSSDVHDLFKDGNPDASSSKSAAWTKLRQKVQVVSDHEKSPEILVSPPSRGRKRKRIISSSSLSGQSAKEEAGPSPATAPRRDRREKASGSRSQSMPSALKTKRATSPLHSGDESDAQQRAARSSSRGEHRESRSSSPDPYAFTYPHSDHSTPQHLSRHALPHPPIPRIQDPEAQYEIVQVLQHLSYLMNAAIGLPSGQGFPPAYSPQYSGQPQSPPYTPSHTRHRSQQPQSFDSPSSGVGASGSSLSFTTPMHRHRSYPYGFDPSFSRASLPPSSPFPSSEPSSPVERAKSVTRGESKARGRRVSFKLDDNDRPLPLTECGDTADDEGADHPASRSRQGRDRKSSASTTSTTHRKGKSKSAAHGPSAGSSISTSSKRKSRSQPEESEAEEVFHPPGPTDGKRGRKLERGCTPGPPSQHERSASARAKRKGQ